MEPNAQKDVPNPLPQGLKPSSAQPAQQTPGRAADPTSTGGGRMPGEPLSDSFSWNSPSRFSCFGCSSPGHLRLKQMGVPLNAKKPKELHLLV